MAGGRPQLGNGCVQAWQYDRDTGRLVAQDAQLGARSLQRLRFTYDPDGKVVRALDLAQDGPGAVLPSAVSARRDFRYDVHGRLVEATGRVHQALLPYDDAPGTAGPLGGRRHLSLDNGAALERYTQRFTYDASGNLRRLQHAGATASWSTDFWVAEDSNRSLPALDPNGLPVVDPAGHFDATGNTIALSHLRSMTWSWRGCLARAVTVARPGVVDDDERYTYGADRVRARKVATRLVTGTGGELSTETREVVYAGDQERVRVRRNGVLVLERWTTHVGEGDQRVAVIDRHTLDVLGREVDAIGPARVRYHLTTPQGSTSLELDETGGLISYEEYLPYGGGAFVAGDDARDVARRDVRYAGKERDQATGLLAYRYRYYAPWLGRWLSCDFIGPEDDLNLYQFVGGDPIGSVDPLGLEDKPTHFAPGKQETPEEALAAINKKAEKDGVRYKSVRPAGKDTPYQWEAYDQEPIPQAPIADDTLDEFLTQTDSAEAESPAGDSGSPLSTASDGNDAADAWATPVLAIVGGIIEIGARIATTVAGIVQRGLEETGKNSHPTSAEGPSPMDEVRAVNRFLDENRDKTISLSEIDNLACVKDWPIERWAGLMELGIRGGYRPDDDVRQLIRVVTYVSTQRSLADAQQLAVNNDNVLRLEPNPDGPYGAPRPFTERGDREAGQRRLNRHRDPSRLIATAVLAVGVVKPEVLAVAGSLLTGVHTGEAITGRSITGKTLSDDERDAKAQSAVLGWLDILSTALTGTPATKAAEGAANFRSAAAAGDSTGGGVAGQIDRAYAHQAQTLANRGDIRAVASAGDVASTAATGERVKDLSTPAKYHVEDAVDADLWTIGQVQNGILDLNIQTRYIARDGTVVRGALRGQEQFDAIVKHFEGQFTAIRGSWHAGDNLAHVARTGNPYTTWTGQQAARHGYGNATRVGYGFLPGTDDGVGGGEYEWVEFLFRK